MPIATNLLRISSLDMRASLANPTNALARNSVFAQGGAASDSGFEGGVEIFCVSSTENDM